MIMKKQKKNTGIHLEGRVLEQDQDSSGRLFALVPVFYMILGVYGWIRTVLHIGAVSGNENVLYTTVLFMGLWFGAVYMAKRWQLLLFAVSVGAAGMFVWQNFARFQEGFIRLGEALLLSGSADAGSYTGWEAEITFAMLAVIFLLYCIFISCLCSETGKYLVIVWMAVPVGAAFVFGRIPDGAGVFCMIFSAMGLVAASAQERDALHGKSALLMGMFGLLLLTVSFASSQPLLGRWFEKKEETRSRIQQTSLLQEMTKLASKWQREDSVVASGGISDGTFNNTDFFLNTGEVLFSAAQDKEPEGNLYLRVYTGVRYTEKQWKEDKDIESCRDTFYARAESAAWNHGYDDPVSLSIGFPEGDEDMAHPFSPYFSEPLEEMNGMKQYMYYPIWCLGELFSSPLDDSTDVYREYVYENYLDYPEKRLPRFREFVEEHPADDMEEICSTVQNLLYENASYNPQVGRFPEDEDFAEYFLFEQKEGYCVHFATAAVLLMRMYGVPARYVTGFTVPAGDFDWVDGVGWLANVKDSRAHAWAEIYVDNYGWIPFETTPSYNSGASLAYDEETREQLEESQAESSPDDQDSTKQDGRNAESEQKESAPEAGSSKSNRKDGADGTQSTAALAGGAGIGAVGIVLILLISGALVLFFRREAILRRRSRQGAAEIFHDMYQVLIQGGMPGEPDCMEEGFTAKVTEQFLWIDKAELDRIMDIVIRANFSGDAISREEVLQVRSMYRYICRMIQKGMTWQKKFYFRFIKVYA